MERAVSPPLPPLAPIWATRGDEMAISHDCRMPEAVSRPGSMNILPTSRPFLALNMAQQDVDLDDVLGTLDLGQQHTVEVRTGHGLQVVAGQAGLEAVHPHHDGLAGLAQFLHHAAHRLAGCGLLRNEARSPRGREYRRRH